MLLMNLIYVQMAGLHWIAVVLAFFLSTGNSLADVEHSGLKSIIKAIMDEWVYSII